MISISRLLCDTISPGDSLRYGDQTPHTFNIKELVHDIPRPVVIWNCTRQCNLNCIHCYASADSHKSAEELTTEEGEAFIHDLADFGIPVLLFSGGEPLLRKDFFHLASLAKDLDLRVALSTNGTVITEETAEKIKGVGFAEVGISLDGIGANNDYFRGHKGAFDTALSGIRHCKTHDLRVSLRLTITKSNYNEIPAIFDLVEKEEINRVCFYHLAYAGRGSTLQKEDINHKQTRKVVDLICERTVDFHNRGLTKEILTVSNHVDGVYLYLKLRKQDPERAKKVLGLLRINGGNNSGIKISSVDDRGNVHPDQFWWHYSLGNVRERKFEDIWRDVSDPLLKCLKDRKALLTGKCSRCRYLDICNGSLRVRAEAVYDDVWAPDPACYLTEEEITG